MFSCAVHNISSSATEFITLQQDKNAHIVVTIILLSSYHTMLNMLSAVHLCPSVSLHFCLSVTS